ncbi:hypothetical protein [Sphingomonas abietis]|uniref:Glycosyltransferase RgtA/B/C/D-like domain-containing protein n=1 Tax=Sphingomonas abietis TaxID=3012344 RepID=A0ABY7NQ93_9SPHN|nr:hypothetical protein [Sphingomonas abietis]WBO22783.1 hypothetical protein PBT88_01100 [Sphingomonas abietis]
MIALTSSRRPRQVRAEGFESRPHAAEARLFRILAWLCLIILVLSLLPPLAGMFIHVSNDYGEGWSAYWSRAAVGGGVLYPVSNTLIANNYPPLFFYADGYLGSLVGDNIFAGRIIAFLSLLAVAAIIGRIVHMLGSPVRWAWMSALLFLLFATVDFREFVGVSNPQWPGQAVALSSLLLLLRVEPRRLGARDIVPAAAIMVVAGLIKHNQIALPLSVTAWLLLYNRRALLIWCLSGALFAGAAVALLAACFGNAIFLELFGFKRTTDFQNFLDGFVTVADLAGLIVVALVASRSLRRDPRAMLLLIFAALGTVSGLGQRMGAGVFLNAHFDGLIGLVLVCGAFLGLAAEKATPGGPDIRARSRWLLLALAPLLLFAPLNVTRTIGRLIAIPKQQRAWAGMIDGVRSAQGPVLCEMLAVCYWADRPVGIDFFAYGQRLRTGTDPRPLERAIGERRLAAMVIDRNQHYFRGSGRLPEPLPRLIERNYAVVLTAKRDLALMVPRH